jgi:hypothetical protein
VLAWASAHRARTGRWPGQHSGPIADAPGERWHRIDAALQLGLRGLPGAGRLGQFGRFFTKYLARAYGRGRVTFPGPLKGAIPVGAGCCAKTVPTGQDTSPALAILDSLDSFLQQKPGRRAREGLSAAAGVARCDGLLRVARILL